MKCFHTHTSGISLHQIRLQATRGHCYTLVKELSRLYVRKYSFSQTTANEWNKVAADCVHSSVSVQREVSLTAGYNLINTCGLSISQRLPCPLQSQLLLCGQYCQILFNSSGIFSVSLLTSVLIMVCDSFVWMHPYRHVAIPRNSGNADAIKEGDILSCYLAPLVWTVNPARAALISNYGRRHRVLPGDCSLQSEGSAVRRFMSPK